MVRVDREHVERSTVVLTRFGVSQRDIPICLEEMLDTRLSSSWVNGQLAQCEAKAPVINQHWQPRVEETLVWGRDLFEWQPQFAGGGQ